MWVEEHLPTLIVLVSLVVFALRMEAQLRENKDRQIDHADKMRLGFDHINERLDKQNGRIGTLELWRARLEGAEEAREERHGRIPS